MLALLCSAITFDTPSTALGYFCGQRRFGEEETDPAKAQAMALANPPMVHYSAALGMKQPAMQDDQTQRDSETWFGDVTGSNIAGKEMASGFFEMHAGNALEYYYDYEELKFIVSGEFHLTDGTGTEH